MNKTTLGIIVGVVLVLLLTMGFFGCERIDQGNIGLRVNLTGGDKGQAQVQDASGWQFYMKGFTRIYEYPTFQQHKEYDPFEVPSKGGTRFTVHPSFNYNINPATVKEMFVKYRVDVKTLEDGFIKNAMLIALREATNRFTVDSVLNNLTSYDNAVQEELQQKLQPFFIVTQFTSNLKPDEKLSETISAKAQSIQNAIKIENDQKAIRAQAENDIISAKRDSSVRVIGALAEARTISVKQEALKQSPQYIELIKAEKWNGVMPVYMLGSGSGMMFNLNNK